MKMNTAQRQYESTVTGPKIKMGFAADAATHLAELMSNSVYQDKYGSIVREVVSNAVDANVEAGSTQLVEVEVTRKNTLSNAVGYFRVRDFGPGITPERIENIFTQYFASTKRDSNDQIGGFGIGAKSPFAYTPVFQVFTYIDGVKRHYLLEKSSAERTCSLMDEIATDEANGTEIRVPIARHGDTYHFVDAIQEQLVLMSHMLQITVPNDADFKMPTVIDYGSFLVAQASTGRVLSHVGLMISLGNVLYKIPWEGREITNFIVKLDIGEVYPTLSREGLELNDKAKEVIAQKLEAVHNVFRQWKDNQSIPTTKLSVLYGYNSRRSLMYPETNNEVLCGDRNLRTFSPKIAGWPEELGSEANHRFTSIVSTVLDISARYCDGKWRSVRSVDVKEVIKQEHSDYRIIRKTAESRLGSVWKEYAAEVLDDTDADQVVVINVNSSEIEQITEEILRHTLSHSRLDQDRIAEINSEVADAVVKSLNEWFQNHTERYSDLQPPAQWLEDRKARMKTQSKKGSKWTKEMLAQVVPVKNVAHGYRRATLSYDMLKQPKVLIVPYTAAKKYAWDEIQPVKIFAAGQANFKRLQKAGCHCLTEEDLLKVAIRRNRLKAERNLWHGFQNLLRLDSSRESCLISMPPQEVKQRSNSLRLESYAPNSELLHNGTVSTMINGKLCTNGAVYTAEKSTAQIRNAKTQLEKTLEGQVVLRSLNNLPIGDDLYRQTINSLLSQHG